VAPFTAKVILLHHIRHVKDSRLLQMMLKVSILMFSSITMTTSYKTVADK